MTASAGMAKLDSMAGTGNCEPASLAGTKGTTPNRGNVRNEEGYKTLTRLDGEVSTTQVRQSLH